MVLQRNDIVGEGGAFFDRPVEKIDQRVERPALTGIETGQRRRDFFHRRVARIPEELAEQAGERVGHLHPRGGARIDEAEVTERCRAVTEVEAGEVGLDRRLYVQDVCGVFEQRQAVKIEVPKAVDQDVGALVL